MNAVRITLSVDPLNIVVRRYLAQDPLTDDGVLLHLPTFVQGEGAFLPEEARRQPNLPDVVHESAEKCALARVCRKLESFGNVARVDRYRARVTGRIRIARLQSSDERHRKGDVCVFKLLGE